MTELEAPHRLVLDATDGGEHSISTFTLTGTSTGTRLDRVMGMPKPGGFVGAVFPVLLKTLINPDVAKGLGKLKSAVESASPPAH